MELYFWKKKSGEKNSTKKISDELLTTNRNHDINARNPYATVSSASNGFSGCL